MDMVKQKKSRRRCVLLDTMSFGQKSDGRMSFGQHILVTSASQNVKLQLMGAKSGEGMRAV